MLVLLAVVGSVVGSPAVARAQTLAYSPGVIEGNHPQSVPITIRRNGLLLPAVTLRVYTVDGTAHAPWDYTPYAGYVSFPALVSGQQFATVTVTVIGDLLPERYEYFNLHVDGAPDRPATVSITDTPDPLPPSILNRATLTKDSPPQQLLSHAADGGEPNAPATEPAVSWDARTMRYAAYTSKATNITAGSGSRRNVYLVKRGGSPGKFGSRWEYGSTSLASRGRKGRPANGDSWSPALSMWTYIDSARGRPCLAFVSRASNLVHGDRNRRADVFVRAIRGGGLRRIAAPGGRAASAVTIAGDCRSIAMVAGGSLYVARTGAGRPRRIARGAISAPHLAYSGRAIGYAKHGSIYVQRIGGRARRIAKGVAPTFDGTHAGGARIVSYERSGAVFRTALGRAEHFVSLGHAPSMSAGATQTMFAYGPFVYMWAVSNDYGRRPPQGFCPQGTVDDIATSARGNYIAFSCKGAAIYLSYIGPK